MRKLIAAAAFATVAGPAIVYGQTIKVEAKQRIADSMRISASTLPPEQFRALAERMASLIVRNKKLEAQLVQGLKDSTLTKSQSEALQDEMDRVFLEVLSTQRQLTMTCMSRSTPELVDGTLGLHVHDTVHVLRTMDPLGGTLTMVFKTRPIIESVDPGSPAERAGVQVGDAWISANGRTLIDSVRFDELLKPGATVNSRLLRGGKEIELKMTVVPRPSDVPPECNAVKQFDNVTPFFKPGGTGFISVTPIKPGERMSIPPMPPGGGNIQFYMSTTSSKILYAGAVMQPLDDEWRQLSGLQGDGLIVTDLPDGSPAEAAGLRRFDVIKMINNEPVSTAAAFQKIARADQKLTFTVYSKKSGTHTVTIVSRR